MQYAEKRAGECTKLMEDDMTRYVTCALSSELCQLT